MELRIIKTLALVAFWMGGTFGSQAQTVVEYVHTDALGTPVAITNAAGTVIERSVYEPYGSLINRPLTDGPGFTGHVQDAATGLTYMQQRYYDPMIGRFLSVDPVMANSGTGGNFNRYWYANNNPYRFTDPDGRYACKKSLSNSECLQAQRSVALINKARRETRSLRGRSVLGSITKFIGKYNDGNGVEIGPETNPSRLGSWSILKVGGTIGVNFATLNAGGTQTERDFMVASTIVHEAMHGFMDHLEFISGRRNVWSRSYILRQERLSGITEGIFAQGLNTDHPQGFWTRKGFNMQAIEDQAEGSTDNYCKRANGCNP